MRSGAHDLCVSLIFAGVPHSGGGFTTFLNLKFPTSCHGCFGVYRGQTERAKLFHTSLGLKMTALPAVTITGVNSATAQMADKAEDLIGTWEW
jgi:hypothetical protein